MRVSITSGSLRVTMTSGLRVGMESPWEPVAAERDAAGRGLP